MNKNKNNKSLSRKKIVISVLIISLAVLCLIAAYAYFNINAKPSLEVAQQPNIPIPVMSNDKMVETVVPLKGQFKDGDAVHSGVGDVSVIDTEEGPILVFSDNFKVTNGPDLFVYLSPNLSNEPLGEFASLGKLKSNTGEQAYNLPSNYSDYKTVVIWCRAFTTTFATAELN